MAQFRLTKKFATDIGISKLETPIHRIEAVDDWFIDVLRIQRRKIAMVTHAKSLVTFLLPYKHVGGAKAVPNQVGRLLKQFLRDNNLPQLDNQIDQIFQKVPTFCKTDNRKILGHMNDFKRCVEARIYYNGLKFDAIDWNDTMHAINNMPVGTQGYKYPTDLAAELFTSSCIN